MSLSTLQLYLHRIQNVHPQTAITALVAAAAAGLLIPGIPRIVRSYHGFLALGRGGMPYNFFGWLLQASLKLIARTDTTKASHYSRPEVLKLYTPLADLSFLAGPPPLQGRSGARPTVPFYTAPQRQTTEIAPGSTRERMESFLRAVVRDNTELLETRPSGLEGSQFDAVWLRSWRDGVAPAFAGPVKGEITHVHPEGSSHLTLGPRDAALVLERGWGERHSLSGVAFPWTYVLVYAPRDEGEWDVWKKLVLASCSFLVSMVQGEVVKITCESEEAEW